MGIVGFIEWCVVVVIIILYLTLFWFILGFSPSASFEKLPPVSATSKISRIFRTGCTVLFTAIIVAITVIWIFWKLLKFISPFILFMGDLIIAIVPPFPQLEEAGIFELWDNMIVSVLTFNIRGVFGALMNFYRKSGRYIFAKFTGVSIEQRKAAISSDVRTSKEDLKSTTKIGGKDKYTKSYDNGEDEGEGEDEDEGEDTFQPDDNDNSPAVKAYADDEEEDNAKPPNPDATEESKYTAQEHKSVQDRIDMCIAEKTILIRDDMSIGEKLKATVNNNNISVTCKAQSVGQYGSIKSTR